MRFEKWVKKQNDEFFAIAKGSDRHLIYLYARGIANDTKTNVIAGAISDCPYRVSVYRKGKKTVMQIINMRKEKRGIAICHENDEFDPEIGIAYAWARYKKEAIPRFTFKGKDLKYGDSFLVGRQCFVYLCVNPDNKETFYAKRKGEGSYYVKLFLNDTLLTKVEE